MDQRLYLGCYSRVHHLPQGQDNLRAYLTDPLRDPRWDVLVASHRLASVFHTRGWLSALAKTYGYRPVAMTSSEAGSPFVDGVTFCEVSSWITGSRLVSLPFTDHCELMLRADVDSVELDRWIECAYSSAHWKYLELRPISWGARPGSLMSESQSFWLHTLDLTPPIEKLFHNLHKSCFQRRIRHAEHEGLVCERGRSEKLLQEFYRLLIMTRRRHWVLPQPRSWFRNLLAEMGSNAEIHLARKDGLPVAAVFSLRHRQTVVYKYGCSDERFHHFAGMPFLFWRLIEESRQEGATQIDFGRTDLENEGLIEFKDRLGATRKMIRYLRYQASGTKRLFEPSERSLQRNLFSLVPRALSAGVGQLAYRHFA